MKPEAIVNKMMEGDAFSQWLGIEVLSIREGACDLQITVRKDMVNGFSIAHGGITYSVSDSALAFAANSYGYKCVSIETSISHTRPVQIGDVLTVKCAELNRGKRYGIYEVTTYNQHDQKVAIFKGTVNISEKRW